LFSTVNRNSQGRAPLAPCLLKQAIYLRKQLSALPPMEAVDFMITDTLVEEINSLPMEAYSEVINFVGYIKLEYKVPETALISEVSLAKDWDTPEEDEVWAYLQEEMW